MSSKRCGLLPDGQTVPALLPVQGVRCWVVLRSQLGTPVGAVQLELCFTHIGGTHWESSVAARPPLVRCAPPGLDSADLEFATYPSIPSRCDVWRLSVVCSGCPSISSAYGMLYVSMSLYTHRHPQWLQLLPAAPARRLSGYTVLPPQGFSGQLVRISLHVEELLLPGGDDAALERPRIANYLATYRLPGG